MNNYTYKKAHNKVAYASLVSSLVKANPEWPVSHTWQERRFNWYRMYAYSVTTCMTTSTAYTRLKQIKMGF